METVVAVQLDRYFQELPEVEILFASVVVTVAAAAEEEEEEDHMRLHYDANDIRPTEVTTAVGLAAASWHLEVVAASAYDHRGVDFVVATVADAS